MLKQKLIFTISLLTLLIADPPDWEVYPGAFEYAMYLTARVYDENTDIGSENDIVGAFNEEECVGVAEASEVPPFLGGGYAFLIHIYWNNSDGNEIAFQYYNADEDAVYAVLETIFFESDAIIGDVVNPFTFSILAQNNNNNPPEAESAAYTLDEDNMITVYLSATDADGDALTFAIQENPNNGTVTLSGIAATYYPDANYHGTDSFSFIVSDGQDNSNSATIDLIINAVNDAPYLYSIPDAEVNAGESFVYDLQAVDVDGDDLTYTAAITSGEGTATLSNNVLIVEGAPNSMLEINITVSDGTATDQKSFVLTVLAEICVEEYEQGFLNGAATGDVNGDGALNIVDIVFFIDMILNGE